MIRSVLLPPLEATLRQAGLWRRSAVLLAAVSGGADSVALLHTLALARKTAGFSLWACYVQHGLRGESTLRDEAFVRELCTGLEVPLRVMEAGLNATMDTAGIETLARSRRRELFRECMAELGADAVLLAHHMDDQAETVLMRLCRGAGMKGLMGMAPSAPFGRGVALRPFLSLPKARLLDALAQAGYPYREDESNGLCVTPRNALRHQVLPRLHELYPEAARHIAGAAEALREDQRCLDELADALYDRAIQNEPPVFALELYSPARSAAHGPIPDALALRALRRLYREGLAEHGLAPDERELCREDSLKLLALARGEAGQSLNLPCGLLALRGRRHLHLLTQAGEPLVRRPPPEPVNLAPWLNRADKAAGEALLAVACFGVTLEVRRLTWACPPPENPSWILLTPELAQQCQLRTPREGDVIRLFGAGGQKPLRRYLTDRKVDAPFRPALPVLAKGSQVLWIPGLCTAEELRASPGPGQWRLALKGSARYLPE